jgi:hypothetical protein
MVGRSPKRLAFMLEKSAWAHVNYGSNISSERDLETRVSGDFEAFVEKKAMGACVDSVGWSGPCTWPYLVGYA